MLADKIFGDTPFTLNATASSGLPVSYTSSNTSVAMVSGNTVTIVGAGTTTITASQTGNANYSAAAHVPQVLTVSKANQTITFNALADKFVGDAPFQLIATASSGLGVSFTSSNSAVAMVGGNTLSIMGAGITTIVASQAGNGSYLAASDVMQTLTIKVITGVEENYSTAVYPNPTNGTFEIQTQYTLDQSSLQIVDLLGRNVEFVLLLSENEHVHLVNILQQNPGVYLLKISKTNEVIRLLKY
jgi:hypothetical protein